MSKAPLEDEKRTPILERPAFNMFEPTTPRRRPNAPAPTEPRLEDISPPADFNEEVEKDLQSNDTLVVSEIFGPTWQGEGPTLGRLCCFVRLGACNLTCGANGGWKCDANYTWDWTGITGTKFDPKVELRKMTSQQILDELQTHIPSTWEWGGQHYPTPGSNGFVVISGGEPLIQQAKMLRLLTMLKHMNWRIEIETNGTKSPLPSVINHVDQFNVSPKLSNSGNPLGKRFNAKAIKALAATGKAVFKFVVSDPKDFKEIEDYVFHCRIPPSSIYLMPEGVSVEAINKHTTLVAEKALEYGYNLTTRLQVIVYGNKRGV